MVGSTPGSSGYWRGVAESAARATRSVLRAPRVSVAIVCTTAMAVGGNLAIYSVLERVLFRAPAGVVRSHELSRLYAERHLWNGDAYYTEDFSYPDYRDFLKQIPRESGLVAYSTTEQTIEPGARHVTVSYVAPGFFSQLGVGAAEGRLFTDFEAEPNAGAQVAVISAGFWQRAFGRDARALSTPLRMGDRVYRIVGVAAMGFTGLDLAPVDVWLPLGEKVAPGASPPWQNRNAEFLTLVLRAPAQVRASGASLTAVFRSAHAQDPSSDRRAEVVPAPLSEARTPGERLPLHERSLSLTERLCAVALAVLFVAISNNAVLLLLLTVRRRHEIEVKLALGLSRARLLLEGCIELVCWAVMASVVGVALGWLGSRVLQGAMLPYVSGDPLSPTLESTFFAVATTFAAVLIAGVAPLIRLARSSAADTLRHAAVGVRDARSRSIAIAIGNAASVLLLTIAGTFLVSMRHVVPARLGFDGSRLVTVVAGMPVAAGVEAALANIQALPSVVAVSNATNELPPGGSVTRFVAAPADPDSLYVSYNAVDTAYFRTVGLNAISGRLFDRSDTKGSEPVVIVTVATAQAFWHDVNPVGRCAYAFGNRGKCRRVIGVVPDVRWDLTGPPKPHFYLPIVQSPAGYGRVLLVRTGGVASYSDVLAITKSASTADSLAAPVRVYRVSDRFALQARPLAGASTLLLALAALVIGSACVGLFSKVAYEATCRTRELGVRMAFGATRGDLVGLLLQSGLRLVGIGMAIGIALAVGSGQLTAPFLFDVQPADPVVLAAVVFGLLILGAIASIAAAAGATRVSPADALRYE